MSKRSKLGQMLKGLFSDDVLSGWRAIALYLGLSVSTVKRYDKHYHLAVRRFPSGRPYAFVFELDTYLIVLDDLVHGRDPKANRKRKK